MITINTLRDLAQGQPKIFGDVSKGTQYTLSISLEKDQWYTLSVQGEFEENEFIGVWLGTDKYIGCLLDNKITFKPEQNYTDVTITLKSLSGEGTIHTITLVKDIVEWPWTPAPEDYTNYDYENKECEIELGLVLPDESIEYVSLGKFTVEKATRQKHTILLNCVDRMYKAEKEYVSDLLYPTTLLDILQSACDQAGIELITTDFINADYVVPNEPVFEGITCRKIFAQIAELAGGYAKISRDGKLEIITLGATPVREITKEHFSKLNINEVAIGKIDKVIVKVGDERAEAGEGENIYTIVDNMFVQNPADVIDDLYNVLKNVNYIACDFDWQGDFSLDSGDKIIVDGHETYILNRKLRYTGGLRENYKSPAKSNIEKQSTGKGSLTLDIENVKTQVKVLSGEISQTIERVENLIVGANNRLFDSQTGIEFGFNNGSGTIQLFRHQIHPYYKVVSEGNIDLFAAFPDSQFAEPLGELGEVTISLDVLVEVDRKVNIDGKEFDVKGNRWTRIHVTKEFNEENTTKRLRVRNPFSRRWTRDISVGTKLIDSLSVGINTLYYRNLKVERGNIATDWTLTPEELEIDVNRYRSEIKQLADSISLLVTHSEFSSQIQLLTDSISQKVSRGNVISEINQSAEQIRIQASKISLEGLVTANSNFKILLDGSIEAKNADISGRVTANSGTIGGWNITSSYIDTRDGSARLFLASHADSSAYYIWASDSSGSRMFSVSKTGVLYARNADIAGSITGSTITSSTITGGTVRTGSGNNRIELSNNLLRSYSGGVRRVQLDYDSLDFYNSDGSKGGEIIGAYSNIWELPVLRLRSDTGVIEMESRISSNNYARMEVVAGHPNIDSPAHVAIEVYQPSVGGLGGIEIGPGGVMTSGFMYVSGDFEVYGQKSAVVETENYGRRKLYAIESPENRFITYIERELEPGEHYIEIEPMFRETISEYFVVPHIQNMASVYIVEILKNGFKVLVENKPAQVVFEINGKRKGYEDVYMEEVNYEHQTE